jgi:hypothetical protein
MSSQVEQEGNGEANRSAPKSRAARGDSGSDGPSGWEGGNRWDSWDGGWGTAAKAASRDQQHFQKELEDAPPDRVFRFVFLINNASVEKYVNQSRQQAEKSFWPSASVSVCGFLLLVATIVIGIKAELSGHSLSVAYLSGVVGALTQFISGVFFWLYNRTLKQITLFYKEIMDQQTDALAAFRPRIRCRRKRRECHDVDPKEPNSARRGSKTVGI